MSDESLTVEFPGAFDCFFSGTSVAQGDPWSHIPEEEAAAVCLRESYKRAKRIKRGKGYSVRLEGLTVDAVSILACYAYYCLDGNYHGDKEYSEMDACRRVMERCNAVCGGRLDATEWYVTLDGERIG